MRSRLGGFAHDLGVAVAGEHVRMHVRRRAGATGLSAVLLGLCAAPVIATEVGGVPELVRNGEKGLLVPPGSPQRLAAARWSLWNDHVAASHMGVAAHGVAWSHSFLSKIERTLAVYD